MHPRARVCVPCRGTRTRFETKAAERGQSWPDPGVTPPRPANKGLRWMVKDRPQADGEGSPRSYKQTPKHLGAGSAPCRARGGRCALHGTRPRARGRGPGPGAADRAASGPGACRGRRRGGPTRSGRHLCQTGLGHQRAHGGAVWTSRSGDPAGGRGDSPGRCPQPGPPQPGTAGSKRADGRSASAAPGASPANAC